MLHDFSYERPGSLNEALAFLADHGDDSTILAGGTDLLVTIRAGVNRPKHVVDIKGIAELHALDWSPDEGLSVGACVTVNRFAADAAVRERFAVAHVAAEELATFQLRNRATVIGNIVTASPCGDMGSPLMVLGGEVELASSSGTRRLPLREFITGVKQTIIRRDEIVTRIIIPPAWAGAAGGYEKLKRIKGHDLGVVSVALIKHPEAIRVAISSAAPTPVLLEEIAPDASVGEVQTLADAIISPIDDVRATADYRRFMVGVFVRRLMERVSAPGTGRRKSA